MEALVERVHESCSASVLDGDDVVYVLRVPTRRIMSINLGIGTRLPAYAASMGRVLLSALPDAELEAYLARTKFAPITNATVTKSADLRVILREVRERGWALVDQELEEGLRSIAVPLSGRSGARPRGAQPQHARLTREHQAARRRTAARPSSGRGANQRDAATAFIAGAFSAPPPRVRHSRRGPR